MADYSQITDYSTKDALATGNPLKLIKGSDVDADFDAISVAIASKFDSTDIATAGEAQAGVSNTVVITPGRLTAWAQNGGGFVEDIQALADPNADTILFWDDSAGACALLSLGAGITITGTTIAADVGAAGGVEDTRTLNAGVGLSGGGTLAADRTFDIDLTTLGGVTPTTSDNILIYDDSAAGHAIASIAALNAALLITAMSDYDANEHIDHTAVTITAGTGLSYSTGGTDISASATIDLDVNELTPETTLDVVNDYVPFYDGSASDERKVTIGALVGDALGDGSWYLSANQSLTAATEATLVFNTADDDNLEKGTFSTVTGEYTAGSASRVLVTAQVNIDAQAEEDDGELSIQVQGVSLATALGTNRGQYGTSGTTITVSKVVTLATSDVLRIRAKNDSTKNALGGVANTYVSIVELS